MFASIPEFKEKLGVSYEDVYSELNIKRYGDLIPPVIIIEDRILTEGHLPIIKKLALELFNLIESSKSKG